MGNTLMLDNDPNSYDEWYKTFKGAVENYIDWRLLKQYLPKNKNAKILDAAGGTGRITLPLARLGYSITMCDISPEMLSVAKNKLLKNELLDKVKLLNCDYHNLPLEDESFDFVMCWNGAFEIIDELIRVTKNGGIISQFLDNIWAKILNNFYNKPNSSLSMLNNIVLNKEYDRNNIPLYNIKNIKNILEKKGIRTIDVYAVCGWTDILKIPEKIQKSFNWDENFFKQTTEMIFNLSKEPSVQGLTKHLVVYGEKNDL